MKAIRLAAAGALLIVPAWAQNAPIQQQSLPPLQQQWQQEGSPPVQQAPANQETQPPGTQQPGTQQPGTQPLGAQGLGAGQQPSTPPPPETMQVPNVWLPGETAKVQALDKINAQTANLTIKIGQSATFGALTITAKACVTRPADQPADAAAYLVVTNLHPDTPGFTGWMLEKEPSVSMMQDPIYDLRVTGCT